MSVGLGKAFLAIAAAVAVHLVAVLVFRNAPVLGTQRFASDVAEAAGRPEFASTPAYAPMRVFLGTADRVSFEGPGPRAALDPVLVRRPPALGPVVERERLREDLVVPLFAVEPAEATRPMNAVPPGSGTPSWFDADLSLASVDVDAKRVVETLPASAAAAVSIVDLAERTLITLDPKEEARRLRIETKTPEMPVPGEWPEPARALRVPEVFVDVLEIAVP